MIVLMLGLILALPLFLYTALNIYLYIGRRRLAHFVSKPVPAGPLWFFGHALDFSPERREKLQFIKIVKAHMDALESDVFVLWLLHVNIVVVVDIPLARHILTNHRTFFKMGPKENKIGFVNGNRVFGNNGILTEEGSDIWYFKRKTMDPAFHKQFLRIVIDDMNSISTSLAAHLRGLDARRNFDIYEVFARVALEVVSKCGFNLGDDLINNEDSTLADALGQIFFSCNQSFNNPLTYNLPWTFKEDKKLLKHDVDMVRERMTQHLSQRIDDIRQGVQGKDDILSYIIRGNQYNNELIVDDVLDDFFAFLIAGMETTAITMAFFIFLILKNPNILAKVKEEVDSVYHGKEDDLDFTDYSELVYMEQCIKETLRLYPPAQATSRLNSGGAVTVDGVHFPKKTHIMISQEIIQRNPEHFEDPLVFNPDRFAPGAKVKPFTFMPFMAGPRSCIGKHFAIIEMKAVLSKLIREFDFIDPYPELKEIETTVILTQKPKHGVFIGLERRVH